MFFLGGGKILFLSKKYGFDELALFFSGVLLFFPLEVLPGLYLSYITSLVLLFYFTIRKWELVIFLLLAIFCVVGSFFRPPDSIFSLAITLYCTFFMLISFSDRLKIEALVCGMKVGVMISFVLFLYALFGYKVFSFKGIFVDDRVWFKTILPYVGNGYAMTAVLAGFVFSGTRFKFLAFFLSLLTTSRLSFLSFLFFLNGGFGKFFKVLVVFLLVLLVLLIFLFSQDLALFVDWDNPFLQRLIKSQDRIVAWSDSFDAFKSSPYFGVGAVDIGYYKHAHNSFLYILGRHGILVFLLYFFIFMHLLIKLYSGYGVGLCIVVLFFGLTQIAYQNISVVLLFAMLKFFSLKKIGAVPDNT